MPPRDWGPWFTALANAGLEALDQFSHGSTLTPDQLAADDALIKSAQAGAGETDIAVLPEIEALIHQHLVPGSGSSGITRCREVSFCEV